MTDELDDDKELDAALAAQREAEAADQTEATPEEPEQAETPSEAAENEPEKAPEPEPVGDQPKTVPLATMLEERRKRQDLEKRLADIEAAQQKAAAKPADEGPKFDDDPMTYLRQKADAFDQFQQQQAEAQQAAQARQMFIGDLAAHERPFRDQNPDYEQAVAFAKQSRIQQLQMFGASPQEAAVAVQREAEMLAANVMGRGGNPAEVFYNYAKLCGYQARPADPVPDPTPAPSKQEIRDQTRSLGSAAGAPPRGKATVAQLKAMDPETDPNWEKTFREVMGAGQA